MLNDPVKLIECPRDAWQGLRKQIPTELKVRYLCALIEAGFKHIDAVSFVSPKAIPQMADSEKVLEQMGPPQNFEIIGIVVDRILDIVEDRADVQSPATRAGVLYSVVINERVTELLDIPAIKRFSIENRSFQTEHAEVSN